MKNETNSDSRSSRQSFRFSISSLLLPSASRSPERTRNIFSSPQNDSKVSFASAGSTARVASEPVRPEEFADSDSSQEYTHSDEEARAAESIYSVIQEYEPQRHSFWFNEEFDSSDGSYENAEAAFETSLNPSVIPYSTPEENLAGEQDTYRSAPVLRNESGISHEGSSRVPQNVRRHQNIHDQSPGRLPDPTISPIAGHDSTTFVNSSQVSDFAEYPEGSTPSKDRNVSLSSGELLGRLDIDGRRSAHGSNRNSVNSEVALQTLIAGIDLTTELPVMVYTVQDRNHPSRWSVYDEQSEGRHASASRLPQATPMPIRDGTSLARRISVSTASNSSYAKNTSERSLATENVSRTQSLSRLSSGKTKSPHALSHVPPISAPPRTSIYPSSGSLIESSGSGPNSEHGEVATPPGVFSTISDSTRDHGPTEISQRRTDPLRFDSKSTPKRAKSGGRPDPTTDTQPYIASPAPSITRDSGERQRYHESMFFEDEKHGVDFREERSLHMPWSKWSLMMVAALVAIPVFFLLPLGVFDHGGFSRPSDNHLGLQEKSVSANWRFQRRYTRAQKLASIFLGLTWIVIVLAMIGVGFGVGLSRQRT